MNADRFPELARLRDLQQKTPKDPPPPLGRHPWGDPEYDDVQGYGGNAGDLAPVT